MLNPLISMHYGGSNHVEYRFVCGLLKCIKPVARTNRCPYVSFCLSSRHANQLGQSKRQTVDEGLDDVCVFQCGLNHTFIIGLNNQPSLLHALEPSKHWIKTSLSVKGVDAEASILTHTHHFMLNRWANSIFITACSIRLIYQAL